MEIIYKEKPGIHCQALRSIFGGNVHNKLKRYYFEMTNSVRCPKCKGLGWDCEYSGLKKGDKCPDCGTTLIHPKSYTLYCPDCQEIKN